MSSFPRADAVCIQRGRNVKSSRIGRALCAREVLFDYRGRFVWSLIVRAWIRSFFVPKAVVLVVEGGLCAWVGMWVKRRRRSVRLILMAPDPVFYLDDTRSRFRRWLFDRRMALMRRYVDGVIAVSDMVKADAELYLDCPIEVAPHFVTDIDRFQVSAPTEKSIVFICERCQETGYVKGLDRVLEVFSELRNRDPIAVLKLVGTGTDRYHDPDNGIVGLGYCDVADVLAGANVLLAPARYDAFPLVVAEALLSGVYPVVSGDVGSRSLMGSDDRTIIDFYDVSDYVQAILWVFSLSPSERERRLLPMIRRAGALDEHTCVEQNIAALERIL